ncbi:hypothetical protein CBL_08451 [Carabus blaptoides fortunei]
MDCLVDLASAGPSQKPTVPRSSSVDAGAKRRRTLEDDGQGDERLTELRNVSDRMREVLVETGTRMTKGNVMTLLERISEMETIVLRVMLENERLKGQLDECRVSEIRNVREKETLVKSCEQCGRTYKLKSSLARHAKECGISDRRKCLHCKVSFPTYQAVRQHERRVHPVEYRKGLEESLPAPESSLMAQIASIEAATIPKPTPAPSTRPNIPTLPRSPCTPPSSLPSVIATPSKSTTLNVDISDGNVLPTTVKRKASTSPATVKHRTTRPRTEFVEVPTTAPAVTASVTSKRKRETSSPPGTPSPQRQRLFRLNSSPADSSGRSMTDLTTPPTLTTTGRTRSSSELDQYTADEGSPNNFALPAYGTDVTILQELTRLRSEADPATKALIDVALQADTVSLDRALQTWTSEIFPPCRPPRQQKGQPHSGRRGPQTKATGQYSRKQERAANYKKCQDLFRHKRTKLANDILDGTNPSTEGDEPTIQVVEDFYRRIFENHSPPDPEPITPEPHISVHLPVLEDDVEAAVSSWRHSAPGPDGITVAQRGFRDVDGTFANILLMEHYVKARRAEGKSFNVVSLDVRKAFDTLIMDRNTNSPGGTITPGLHVAAIGFADDLVLLEDKDTTMALSLARCSGFLDARGMSINPAKSVSVSAAAIKGISTDQEISQEDPAPERPHRESVPPRDPS